MNTILVNIINEIKKIIYMIIPITCLFYFTDIASEIYLSVLFFMFIILLRYNKSENIEYIIKYCIVIVIFSIAYAYVWDIKKDSVPNMSIIDKVLVVCSFICFVKLVYGVVYGWLKKDNTGDKAEIMPLFECRQFDMNKIKNLITRVNIVGINSGWGHGKTFLVDCLLRENEIKDSYEVIKIDLLTCNLNELEIRLMKELDKVLLKNNIYSSNSKYLIDMLGNNKSLINIHNLLLDSNKTLAESFSCFREDIGKLDKHVLVIFDDVDRISDKDNLIKLFGIADKLVSSNTKIMYLYHQDNLLNIGFSREYIEKYIPYMINLTEISFCDCVNDLWEELDMGSIGIDKNEILDIFNIVSNSDNYNLAHNIDDLELFDGLSIRKVIIFMNEVKVLLEDNKYEKKEDRMIVINFLFIKHFMYEYYKLFSIGKGLEETLLFRYDGITYTLLELVDIKYKSVISNIMISPDGTKAENKLIGDIFSKNTYRHMLIIGKLLDYQIYHQCDSNEFVLFDEEIKNLKKQVRAERINHIIWDVLGNGMVEYRNLEYLIYRFVNDILYADEDKQNTAWYTFITDGSIFNLARTCSKRFKLSSDMFMLLFLGFRVLDCSEEHWMKLLDFYSNKQKDVKIEDLILCLTYCDLTKKNVLLSAIDIFCKKKIVVNIAQCKGYDGFYEKYFNALQNRGYLRRNDGTTIVGYDTGICDERKQEMIDSMELEIDMVKKLKEGSLISTVKLECDMVERFIYKNIEALQYKSKLNNTPKVEIINTDYIESDEEYIRLSSMLNQENVLDEMDKSYKDGRIDLAIVKALTKRIKEKEILN